MSGPETGSPPSGPRAYPLTEEQRVSNYLRQTGARWRLTPKQRRRADHKANRAAVRAAR